MGFRESGDSPTHFELSWRLGESVGFLFEFFRIFGLTMIVVKGREVAGIRSSCSTSWGLGRQHLLAQISNMRSRDSLHASRRYNTCISDNNKSRRRGRSLKTKAVKRL